MLTLEQIKEKLQDRNLSKVGREVKITPSYIAAIAKGTKKNPGYEIVKKLSDYLEEQQ